MVPAGDRTKIEGSNDNMNAERRKRLQEKVAQEKQKNAGLPVTTTTGEPDTVLAWGKHFVSEIQADDEGNDVFAVYRVTDWLSNAEGAVDPASPVHVFDLVGDAAVAIVILDKLVDKIEGEDTVGVELPQQQSTPVEIKDASPTP